MTDFDIYALAVSLVLLLVVVSIGESTNPILRKRKKR